ncbi:ATP-binding cassette domain-containing protein, partial [Burkholderia multivorans]|uniref:ATP-binding cassette domain-containing protein n=1 Tax=Burkholderia multivorans TaxID=87883 RepID=UPI003D35E66F
PGRSLLEILHRGDEHRSGLPREHASRALARYELAGAAEQTFDSLSGGQQARFQIPIPQRAGATLLLLDEPTNNLDAESVLWLEQHLKTYPGAVIAITHDRYFLDHVAEWIAEVDRGHLYPYEGNYSTYLEKKQERLQVQGKKDAKLAKRLKDELEWVRSNPKAKQT